MPWPLPRLGALACALALSALIPASASADGLKPASCTSSLDIPGSRCGTLTVPVDRAGAVPGTVSIFVEIVKAEHPSKNAMVVFPGGPGASTTLLAKDELPAVKSGLVDHDLVLFDQRGTGRSDYLDCDVVLTPNFYVPAGEEAQALSKTVQRCAKKLGPRRNFYTTRETVADLEAVRQAMGYDRLDLVGVSYGTRDAMAYARAHPEHTERIVLDSLVPDSGLDPFALTSIHAIPRLLTQVCRNGGCDGITTNALGDLETLVAKLQQAPMRAKRPVEFVGCRIRPAITRGRLYSLFEQADEDPKLLSRLPVAIAAAAHGDPYQLSELEALGSPYLFFCALGHLAKKAAKPTTHGPVEDVRLLLKEFSPGNLLARTCEETQLPWPRDSLPWQRRRDAENFLAPMADSAFAPFDRATVLSASLVALCKFWMAAPQPPEQPTGPLPAVPVLILAGLDDLRTPSEDALALARQTPTAQFLAVPDVGHSTLSISNCARRAFTRFMAGRPISPCHQYAQSRPAPVRKVGNVFSRLEQALENAGP